MLIQETGLAGVRVIEVEKKSDERGYFARTFCEGGVRGGGVGDAVCPVELNRITGGGGRCGGCISNGRRMRR